MSPEAGFDVEVRRTRPEMAGRAYGNLSAVPAGGATLAAYTEPGVDPYGDAPPPPAVFTVNLSDAEPVQITASIENAKRGLDNIALAPGDTVMVEQTPATVVVDMVKAFFNIGLSAAVPVF